MGPTWLYRPGIIQTVPRFMNARRLTAAYLAPLALTAARSVVFGLPGLVLRLAVTAFLSGCAEAKFRAGPGNAVGGGPKMPGGRIVVGGTLKP